MAKNPDTTKKPAKAPKSKAPNSKASRPDVQPIGPALAELLNPAINRGESGLGSSTGLQPPPDNSWDRRSGGEAAAHRARASTKGTSGDVAKRMRQRPRPLIHPHPTLPRKRERAPLDRHRARTAIVIPRLHNLRPLSRLRGPRRAKLALEARVGAPQQVPASTKPRSVNSRRPITAQPPPFPRSIPSSQNSSASPPKRKMPPHWRGRRATRWRRSASPPLPTRWKA